MRRLARWVVLGMLGTAGQASATATVRAVRHITTPATSRLVIECSEPVRYRLQRLPARPDLGVPARLYVDVLDSRAADAVLTPAQFPEGPLLRLRASEPTAASTRLILDVPGLTEYGAFQMLDPFRLIVDVRGTPRAAPANVAPNRNGDAARNAPADVPGKARPAELAVARVPPPGGPPASAAPQEPRPARRVRIVIDPGHGGKDPGALGVGGLAEKDVTLAIAQRLRTRLATVPDVDVVLTRESDVYLALEERTVRANAEHADLFVSIHTNASSNPQLAGVESYYLNNTNDRATIRLAKMENGLTNLTGQGHRGADVSLILSDLIQSYKVQESVKLAEDIQRALVDTLETRHVGAPNLGVKRGPFYVLVGAGMPCVLAEVSFLTNPKEGRRLGEASYQDAIAEGLLHGIQRFIDNARMAENL